MDELNVFAARVQRFISSEIERGLKSHIAITQGTNYVRLLEDTTRERNTLQARLAELRPVLEKAELLYSASLSYLLLEPHLDKTQLIAELKEALRRLRSLGIGSEGK